MRKIVVIAFLVLTIQGVGAQDIAFCNSGNLRIRQSPVLTAAILGTVDTYDQVTILEKSAQTQSIDGYDSFWYRIRTQSGIEGWAFGGYLEIFSADKRTFFNGLFSMELPSGSKASPYPCLILGNEREFTLTQSYAINYLGSTMDLVVYCIPRETTRREELQQKFGGVINPSPPSVSVARLSALLEADPAARRTSDWTDLQLTAANLTTEMTHDVLIACFSSPDNTLFTGGYLVFHNLWKDSKDAILPRLSFLLTTAEIAQKRVVAQNYEMVLNALSTLHLIGQGEEGQQQGRQE